MKTILFIDTSSNKRVKVGLEIDGKREMVEQDIDHRRAQIVLPIIEELLAKHKLTTKDITAITVNAGPGSFTGLRVGVTIANTLGFLLQVPINGQKPGEMIDPV